MIQNQWEIVSLLQRHDQGYTVTCSFARRLFGNQDESSPPSWAEGYKQFAASRGLDRRMPQNCRLAQADHKALRGLSHASHPVRSRYLGHFLSIHARRQSQRRFCPKQVPPAFLLSKVSCQTARNSSQQLAGIRIDPPPSLPCAIGKTPAATAAAEPPLEPAGVKSGFYGLRQGPNNFDSVTGASPSSGVFVFPNVIRPDDSYRLNNSDDCSGT